MSEKPTYEELEKRIQELEQGDLLPHPAEGTLREDKIIYSQLFDKMKDGVAVYEAVDGGKDFVFVDINAAGERITNVKKSEIIGKSLYEIRPNIEEFGLVDVLRNVWQTGKAENHSERFYEDEKLQGWFDNYVYKLESGEVVAIFVDNTAIRFAEKSLKQRESLLNATQQLTKVGGWEWDVKKQIIFWTDEVYRIHDFQRSDFAIGSMKHIEQSMECYDPKDHPVILKAFKDCVEKGEPYDLEFPFRTVKGGRIWIRTVANAIKEKGDIVRVIGNIMDISDRKQAEKALKESEKQFLTIFQNNPAAIAMTHLNSNRFTNVNKAWQDITGYSSAEAIGRTSIELSLWVNAEQRDRFIEMVQNQGKAQGDIQLRTKSGEIHDLLFSAEIIELMGQDYLLTMAQDITERKRNENELKIRDEKLSDLSNQTEQLSLATASMISIKEEQQFFDKISKAIIDFSDFKRVIISLFKEDAPFRDIITFGGVEQELIDKLRKVEMPKIWYDKVFIEENIVGQYSYYIPHTKKNILNQKATVYGSGFKPEFENRWHPEDNLFVRMYDGKGNTIGVISVDESKSGLKPSPERVRPLEIFSSLISQIVIFKKEQKEKEKIENQLQKAQKMESIGTLAGGIAHDFNNLLYMIIGNTDLALEDIPKWNPAYTNLEEIKSAGLRAAGIVKHLLNFSRKTDQKLIPIDAVTVIKDSLKFLRSTIPSTVEIREHLPNDDIVILADAIQINQIMMNLCINASQAIEETGGTLKINIEKTICEADDVKEFSDLVPGNYLKIKINDTGPGIGPEIIDRIFDPYFTTKEMGEGSGMGLSIVQGIIKNHGGVIWVDSSLGKGTTFTLLFPMVEEKPVNKTEANDEYPSGTETILFVDDEQAITDMSQQVLEKLGYRVEARMNPIEALDLFQSKPDAFDLVMTDMTMPQMTGAKLSEKLKQIQPDIPVIICTGHSSLIDEEKAKRLGIAGYVMKPASMSTIAKAIRNVLDR